MVYTASARFVYEPLEPGWIRVLHILPESTPDDIRCSLEYRQQADEDINFALLDRKDLFDVPPDRHYAALSYCWGDPTLAADVTVNGKLLGITQNLFDFLQQAVRNRDVREFWRGAWWIDAICLNQADVEEKSEQVGRMWRIFSQARFVYVWLGPEAYDTKTAFDLLHVLGHANARALADEKFDWLYKKYGGSERFPRLPPEVLSAVETLFKNAYWSRVWVVQELLWARFANLMCGSCIIPLRNTLMSDLQSISYDNMDFELPYHDLLNQFENRRDDRRVSRDQYSKHPICYALETNQSRLCSDGRDQVFGALSLPSILASKTPWQLQPDYSLTLEELAAITITGLDGVSEQCDEIDDGFPALDVVLPLLAIDFYAFRSWLKQRSQWNEESVTWSLSVGGRTITLCASLHHHLYHLLLGECEDVRRPCDTSKCPLCEQERKLEMEWDIFMKGREYTEP